MDKLAAVRQDLPKLAVSGGIKINTIDDLTRLAQLLSQSNFFEDCKQAAQAGVKILAGMELGFPAFASMTGIYIIKGKPAIGANLMAAAVKRSGKYNYRVIEHTDQSCKIAFFEHGQQIGLSEFTAKDAAKTGTQNMGKFPRNMLFARAISNGVKWFCPDIFLGAPVYTPEELGAVVEVDSEDRVTELSGTQTHEESEVDSLPGTVVNAHLLNPRPAEGIWRTWKSPQDAILWASTVLPDLTHEDLQKLFDEVPVINGKKAPAWVEKVLSMAVTF